MGLDQVLHNVMRLRPEYHGSAPTSSWNLGLLSTHRVPFQFHEQPELSHVGGIWAWVRRSR